MRHSELSVLLLRGQGGFGRGRLVEAGRLLGSVSFDPSRSSREKRGLKHTDSTSSQSRRHWRYTVACCLEQKGSNSYEIDFSLRAKLLPV